MEHKNIIKSEKFRKTVIGLGILVAILVIFQAGVEEGYRKASFSHRLGDNFSNTFGEHKKGEEFPNSHGAFGKIVKFDGTTMVISDRDGTEKVVLVDKETIARKFRDNIDIKSLKIGDDVVVIGSPNEESQVEAKLIRLMVPPPMGAMMGTTTKKQ